MRAAGGERERGAEIGGVEVEERGIYAKEKLTKESILETVIYRMANREAIGEFINRAPHIDVMDMVATYYCIFSKKDDCHVGAFIDEEACSHFGIRKDELDAAARRNTETGDFVIKGLNEVLGIPRGGFESGYVLTNGWRLYGASIILYQDYLGSLAERMGEDLYILPSSIHEVIAVSAAGGDPFGLQDIVKVINGSEDLIRRDDVLSNNVYRYSQGSGLMCVTLDGKRK